MLGNRKAEVKPLTGVQFFKWTRSSTLQENVEFGRGNAIKHCVLTYLGDPPQRAEAVTFFNRLKFKMFPRLPIPSFVYDMSQEEAQQYLNEHPIQKQWEILTILTSDQVSDEDLSRLEYLPELRHLKLVSDRTTDLGRKQLPPGRR